MSWPKGRARTDAERQFFRERGTTDTARAKMRAAWTDERRAEASAVMRRTVTAMWQERRRREMESVRERMREGQVVTGIESLAYIRGMIGDMSAADQERINALATILRCVSGLPGGVPALALVAAEWQVAAEETNTPEGE